MKSIIEKILIERNMGSKPTTWGARMVWVDLHRTTQEIVDRLKVDENKILAILEKNTGIAHIANIPHTVMDRPKAAREIKEYIEVV